MPARLRRGSEEVWQAERFRIKLGVLLREPFAAFISSHVVAFRLHPAAARVRLPTLVCVLFDSAPACTYAR